MFCTCVIIRTYCTYGVECFKHAHNNIANTHIYTLRYRIQPHFNSVHPSWPLPTWPRSHSPLSMLIHNNIVLTLLRRCLPHKYVEKFTYIYMYICMFMCVYCIQLPDDVAIRVNYVYSCASYRKHRAYERPNPVIIRAAHPRRPLKINNSFWAYVHAMAVK